jgi:hypothetical protein
MTRAATNFKVFYEKTLDLRKVAPRPPVPGRILVSLILISGAPVAIETINRSGSPSLLPQLQMAALALAVKGILYVRTPGLGRKAVTAGALLYREPLAPEVPGALIVMVALGASHPPFFMETVVEPYRGLFPGALEGDFQPGGCRRLVKRCALDPPSPEHPQEKPCHPSPAATFGQCDINPGNKRRRTNRIPTH